MFSQPYHDYQYVEACDRQTSVEIKFINIASKTYLYKDIHGGIQFNVRFSRLFSFS